MKIRYEGEKDYICGMKEINNEETALLIIDMQKDFVEPGAVLCVSGAQATIPAIENMAARCRRNGIPVIHIVRSHDPSGCNAEPARKHLFKDGRGYCVAGTRGAESVIGIDEEKDTVVSKSRFSGFFRTTLDEVLERLGIRCVMIAGTQYPNCVRATAVDALSRDYRVVIVTDCCSAASPDVADANIRDMERMGIECLPSTDLQLR